MILNSFTKELEENWRKTGIYCIKHSSIPNGIYVGQASRTSKKACKSGFYYRWQTHIRTLYKGTHHNIRLQRIANKYGMEGFSFHILEFIENTENIEIFNSKELYYINSFHTKGNDLFNLSLDSKSFKGLKHTTASKEKMSNSRKGRKIHPNTFAAIMKANIGKIKSEETRKKLSLANKGKIRTVETKKKISKIHKGIKLKNRRKVIAFNETENLVFDSYIEAAEHFNLSYSRLRALCKPEAYPHKGYKIRYLEETTRTNAHRRKKLYLYENGILTKEFESAVECISFLKICRNTLLNHLKCGSRLRNHNNIKVFYNKQ